VGNKIDHRGSDLLNPYFEDQVAPLMNEFKEIVTCTECSAKSIIYVPEVFYYAQKAVLHPIAPLYDAKEHKLKPKATDALRRIFRLIDKNKDHLLSDEELNDFQKKCFNSGLSDAELSKIKELIKDKINEGWIEHGITETGFLFLHLQLIQQGRLETIWTILRKFGYGEDLSLRESFLSPYLQIGSDSSVELSAQGYQFFAELFRVHDKVRFLQYPSSYTIHKIKKKKNNHPSIITSFI
jgi:Ras family protein T1